MLQSYGCRTDAVVEAVEGLSKAMQHADIYCGWIEVHAGHSRHGSSNVVVCTFEGLREAFLP